MLPKVTVLSTSSVIVTAGGLKPTISLILHTSDTTIRHWVRKPATVCRGKPSSGAKKTAIQSQNIESTTAAQMRPSPQQETNESRKGPHSSMPLKIASGGFRTWIHLPRHKTWSKLARAQVPSKVIWLLFQRLCSKLVPVVGKNISGRLKIELPSAEEANPLSPSIPPS